VSVRNFPETRLKSQESFTPPVALFTTQFHDTKYTGDTEPLPRPGRPEVTTRRQKRALVRIARARPRININQLKHEAGAQCHSRTVYNILQKKGIRNRLAKKRPDLSENNDIKGGQARIHAGYYSMASWQLVIRPIGIGPFCPSCAKALRVGGVLRIPP
jgi:hypothetical protein